MSLMSNILTKTGIGALAVGAALAVSPMKADAAVIYATTAEAIVDTGLRGTANDRNNLNNAFGIPDGSFFELGYESVYEFQFGTPSGQSFFGPGSIVEVTFGSRDNFPEAVMVQVGLKGDAASFITALPNPVVNGSGGSSAFTFSGVFDTVRLTDVTRTFCPPTTLGCDGSTGSTGGFDVDAISVQPVPLPAGGLLLLTALGGMAVARRRRKAA